MLNRKYLQVWSILVISFAAAFIPFNEASASSKDARDTSSCQTYACLYGSKDQTTK